MYVRRLSLVDYRNYPSVAVDLGPGPSVFVGANGEGKTNLVEALGYVATLGSHRVALDAPLVRVGAERAVVRVAVVSGARELLVELEIVPGRANRARLNRSPVSRPRDILGALRTVSFAPEDLALVRGDPSERRRFVDELLVARSPRFAAVRADYDRVLKQRNALLRTVSLARRAARGSGAAADLRTLDVWDGHLAAHGAELLAGRWDVLAALAPHVEKAYDAVSAGGGPARLAYRSSLAEPEAPPDPVPAGAVVDALAAERATAPDHAQTAEPTRGPAASPAFGPASELESEPELDAASEPAVEPAMAPARNPASHPAPSGDPISATVSPPASLLTSGSSGLSDGRDTPRNDREALTERLLAALARARPAEVERGVTLVGPHRDDIVLSLGDLPTKGYASHGESWSFALALRLASYELLASDGGEPVLILDDVFAELDTARRDRLAGLVAEATQVLVTAAVPVDVPEALRGARYDVAAGEVRRVR